MLDLAIHAGGAPVQCHDIALRQEIPEPYLIQLLTVLRRAGLIESRRGPGGGHHLARPAAAIRLGAIVDALDGVSDTLPDESRTSCAGALRDLWRDAGASARRVVDGTTLAEVAQRVRERTYTYHI